MVHYHSFRCCWPAPTPGWLSVQNRWVSPWEPQSPPPYLSGVNRTGVLNVSIHHTTKRTGGRRIHVCLIELLLLEWETFLSLWCVKSALCSFGNHFYSEEKDLHWRIIILCSYPSTSKTDKLTIKDNTISDGFTLFICGGPCHLSSFKQCSRNFIFLWKQFFYSIIEKMNISEFVLWPY